jgi:hypothetical protein
MSWQMLTECTKAAVPGNITKELSVLLTLSFNFGTTTITVFIIIIITSPYPMFLLSDMEFVLEFFC